MKKRITMTDIAQECGVSQTLVSFVMTGKSKGVSEKTRQKVLDAAKKLGYANTSLLSSSKCVGVICDSDFSALPLPAVLSGAAAQLALVGYSLRYICCSDELDGALIPSVNGYLLITSNSSFVRSFAGRAIPFYPVISSHSVPRECGALSASALLDIIENRSPMLTPDSAAALTLPGVRASSNDAVWLL